MLLEVTLRNSNTLQHTLTSAEARLKAFTSQATTTETPTKSRSSKHSGRALDTLGEKVAEGETGSARFQEEQRL